MMMMMMMIMSMKPKSTPAMCGNSSGAEHLRQWINKVTSTVLLNIFQTNSIGTKNYGLLSSAWFIRLERPKGFELGVIS